MLAFSRSLLKREYSLMIVQKALASILSMCNLHVILLSKITPRYFTLFTNGMLRPFSVRRDSGGALDYEVSRLLGYKHPVRTSSQCASVASCS
jgi:hypothetical protein